MSYISFGNNSLRNSFTFFIRNVLFDLITFRRFVTTIWEGGVELDRPTDKVIDVNISQNSLFDFPRMLY